MQRSSGRHQSRRPQNRPNPRERARELAASGMPHQMAFAVAYGHLSLNDALERLAQREKVNRLMERHDLSRALATQIVKGQADLEQILARRRLEAHRAAHRDDSVLEAFHRSGEPLTLLLHEHRRWTGRIVDVGTYEFRLQSEQGDHDLHKLEAKAAFHPDAYKKVRKVLKMDPELKADPKGPIERPQDRYTCSDRRLFRYVDQGQEVQVTLLEGELLRGRLVRFARYEVGLEIKGGFEIVLFRHALSDLRSV